MGKSQHRKLIHENIFWHSNDETTRLYVHTLDQEWHEDMEKFILNSKGQADPAPILKKLS